MIKYVLFHYINAYSVGIKRLNNYKYQKKC